MPIQVTGVVGPVRQNDGVGQAVRQGRTNEVVVTQLHGRYFEQNFRGKIFSDGLATVQAITAATFNISTLTASCTPIAGIWNPITSGVNAVLLSAVLNCIKTALQNTGGGPFFWAASVGNTAQPSTGNSPTNRSNLTTTGSAVKGMANAALTGLTNNLTVRGASALFGGGSCLAAFLETQAGDSGFHMASKEQFEGEWIVPPGGVIALLAGSAPVAVSATSMLVWEEEPV